MRHFDLMSVVDGPFADRPGGQAESTVGLKRDAEFTHKAAEVGDLRSLRLANEAAIAWAEQATRCASLTDFEVSLASIQKVAAAIQAGDARIATQEALLRRMEARHWPTRAATELLETMRRIQGTMRQHLERLEEELGSSLDVNRTCD